MPIPLIVPIAMMAISAIGTGVSIAQQSKAAEAQKEAAQQENNLASLENRKARIKAVREARIARAQTIAQGEASGALGSSGVAGGTSSIQSQLGSNIGFANQREAFSQNIAGLQNKAISAQNKANTFGTIGQFAGTVFNQMGGFDTIFRQGEPKY